MRDLPIHKLPPIPIWALRTMTRETLHREGSNWLPGYVCPAGERHTLPFNDFTIRWLASEGLCRIVGNAASITDEGRAVLDKLDDWRVAA
jgi:hypothetical protein